MPIKIESITFILSQKKEAFIQFKSVEKHSNTLHGNYEYFYILKKLEQGLCPKIVRHA